MHKTNIPEHTKNKQLLYKNKIILELFFKLFASDYIVMRIFEEEISLYLKSKLENKNDDNLNKVLWNMKLRTLSNETSIIKIIRKYLYNIFVCGLYEPYYIVFINSCYSDEYIVNIAIKRLKVSSINDIENV